MSFLAYLGDCWQIGNLGLFRLFYIKFRFSTFFFRKRKWRKKTLALLARRQTARSLAKIFIPLRSKEKFLNAHFAADLYRRISSANRNTKIQYLAFCIPSAPYEVRRRSASDER